MVEAMQQEGIAFYGMRNEQSAGYAASVYGYLTATPGVCVTVSGPGMLHALPGLLNATENSWPMLLISSGPYTDQLHRGSFQEAPQLHVAAAYAKHSARVENLSQFEYHLAMALRIACSGRPGGVYLELASQLFDQSPPTESESLVSLPPLPRTSPHPDDLSAAAKLLLEANKPLLIFGKGAAYSRAEEELTSLVDTFGIPFLSSPMGKGVVSESHSHCVAAARSMALECADVVLIFGAQMNWMWKFGKVFNANAKLIQVDISPEAMNHNIHASVCLIGDAKVVAKQLTKQLSEQKAEGGEKRSEWLESLRTKVANNVKSLASKLSTPTHPLGYHYVLHTIDEHLPRDAILVNEGANTMDIGRQVITHTLPRSRLDAGTLGTMGVGAGYAIAAAIVHPERKVVTVQGDSAFGFSAMEVEVACRYNLPITFIVINNNGIYRGDEEQKSRDPTKIPPTLLTPDTHYEKIIEAFGGKGFYCENADNLSEVVAAAISCPSPCVLNIKITPFGPIPAIVHGK